MPPGLEYNIADLYQEAQKRWLKPIEVLYVLQNHDKCQFTQEPPQKPTSGSLFLFNRRVLRYFRRDGHSWRKKRDGRTVGEAHERLKVGNVETLNCYYAHGEQNPTFQRRSYWMLDPAYEHIVLVHYRETSEAKSSSGSVTQSSPGFSSVFTQNPGSTSKLGDSYEPNQNFSSPDSLEVTSDIFGGKNGMDHLDGTIDANSGIPDELKVTQALRQLEEQLNEDSCKETSPSYSGQEIVHDLNPQQNLRVICKQDTSTAFPRPDDHGHPYYGYNGTQGDSGKYYHELLDRDFPDGNEKGLSWKEVLESCEPLSVDKLPEKDEYKPPGYEKSLSSLERVLIPNQENSHWPNFNNDFSLPQGIGGFKVPPSPNSDYHATLFDQSQIGEPLYADSGLTVAQKQKFTIRVISPEWGYATETTKVIIIGAFLCLPSDSTWACMFGDVEVPVEIIQDGVICCEAPSHLPGKVTLCITSGNRESCSEVREFEYRNKTGGCTRCNSLETEATRSPEESLLLVKFAEMLLSASTAKNDNIECDSHLLTEQKTDDDSWSHVIDALLVGSGTSSGITDWLLEKLLKDKLQLWLSCRSRERYEETGCSLSKKEQGIIHMVAGLGFEWALNPILNCGVNINFRDINGWTALHWAAKFGREKMVASLIASGASAGAVTDPTSQDPAGKTAASIADSNGHKGLAGYLSEIDLTSHLSSLTLEESEISKGSAELEAELTVSSVSKENLAGNEDHVPLRDILAAIRNATQAAARIQAAFRARSFEKRRMREAAATAAAMDGYGISAGSVHDISELPAMSKLSFRSSCDSDSAALSIQKKYRGWKGRKDFLAFRQKVVKIQAYVRGYQVRKQYKVILWAVGILEKVVLRWRRKAAGLRGFRPEMESTDESEEEDFLKAFRKQKVDIPIEEALSRVLSMVHCPNARWQYHRLLEMYRQAKVEVGSTTEEASSSASAWDASNMEDDDLFRFPWGELL